MGMATRSRYDELKEFNGKRYTGMRVGRGHTWRYDAGEWKERKVTPDRWEFRYAVPKRRAGRAPEGSGAPVGTAYHWYIVADQVVTKLDANSYMTEMVGYKLKLGHRRADKASWNASDRAQRKQLVKQLRALIAELESAPEQTDARETTQPGPASRAPRATHPSRAAHATRSAHRRTTAAPQPRSREGARGSSARASSNRAATQHAGAQDGARKSPARRSSTGSAASER
jgi:hypothetical protein